MKVIGAGLPRTATTTQMLALEMLGVGPCYHMRDLMADLEGQLGHWEAALDGNADWDVVFDGYQSVTDWPGSFHWRHHDADLRHLDLRATKPRQAQGL